MRGRSVVDSSRNVGGGVKGSQATGSMGGHAGLTPLLGLLGLLCVVPAVMLLCVHRRRRRRANPQQVAVLAEVLSDGRVGQVVEAPSSATDVKVPRTIEDIMSLKDTVSVASFFQLKRDWLGKKLSAEHPRDAASSLQIVVRREQVFQDSFLQFSVLSGEDLHKQLCVHFVGEPGRDDGGITRDWYTILSREIVDPQYALFRNSAIDNYTFQINPNSDVNPDHLEFFHFIGVVLAKAVRDGCLLDCHFTSLFYKRLLGRTLTYDDMSTVDVEFHRSLCWLLENNINGLDLGLYFVAELDRFGLRQQVELKPGGADFEVTDENKQEYVDLLARWTLKESVEAQSQGLLAGFASVIPLNLLQHFDETELEWLMGGLPKLDISDWRANTVYKAGYTADSPVIVWLWELITAMDQEMRARLLQFVTGTSKVPYPQGFKGLMGSDGPRPFHIVRVTHTYRLPQAHTCFNELILPPYSTKERLKVALQRALFETGNCFGLR
eukprot:jgi/Chlat1/7834/Chrsp66S07338